MSNFDLFYTGISITFQFIFHFWLFFVFLEHIHYDSGENINLDVNVVEIRLTNQRRPRINEMLLPCGGSPASVMN